MNAARMRGPIGPLIGMFCKLGSLLESRPVAATAWWYVVWMRPVRGLINRGSASTYVDFNLASWR